MWLQKVQIPIKIIHFDILKVLVVSFLQKCTKNSIENHRNNRKKNFLDKKQR